MKSGPHRYEINGHRVKCSQRQHEFFDEGEAQLNTAGLIFFNLDWANKTATILACRKYGFIMWFVKKFTKVANR